MKFKEKLIIFILNTLLCIAAVTLVATLMDGWGVFVLVIAYAVPSICLIMGIISLCIKKDVILKSCFVITVCAFVIILAISLITRLAGLSSLNTDGEKIDRLTQIIRNTGKWGMVTYVFIQILQVVILPLPALVCYVPGSNIWGAGIATLLASIGVITGSVITYCIGRFFGKKAVVWIAGKETTEKYVSYIGNRGKMIFVLMQILPFFPDDILCMIAGLTSMSFPFFIAVMIVIRPLIIAVYCYFGNGSIIPFSGWGIPVWIVIIAVCIALAVLSFKYQDKVEKWLVGKFKRVKSGAASKNEKNLPRENQDREEYEFVCDDDIKGEKSESEETKGDIKSVDNNKDIK